MENRLAKSLVDNGVIHKDDLEKILRVQQDTDEELEEILINKGFINEDLLYEVINKEFNIKNISLKDIFISNDVIKILPKEIVKKYSVIPFGIDDRGLHLAMISPFNMIAIEEIKFITNKEVIPYIERKSNILFTIESYYEKEIARKAIENLKDNNTIQKELNQDLIKDSPIVKLTNAIINQAINVNASDIHLEPSKEEARIRFRIDGVLKEKIKIPIDVYFSVCKRIKIESGMDISKKMIPEDGNMIHKFKNKEFSLRISSIPTINGEKIVMRILYKLNEKISLKKVVSDIEDIKELKNILKHTSGIVLITGPTGSGKTTTLCSLLNELDSKEKNIITIEDPVEYHISGVNQMNVNNKAGLTFSNGLRSILRQDPDIIMVGEIRDEETAEIAVKASITGHLVLSTLHTRDSSSAILRLADMNVPSYLIADSLISVVAQRLVRKICPYCKEAYDPSDDEKKMLSLDAHSKLYKGRGCKYCNGSGYKGRKALFEIMDVEESHRELIRKKQSSIMIKNWSVQNGMITLNKKCETLVKEGVTTFEEMVRISYDCI